MVDDSTAPTPPKRRRRKAPPLLLPFDDAEPGAAPAAASAHATPDDLGPARSDAPATQAATPAVDAAEPTPSEGSKLPVSVAEAPEEAAAAPVPARRRKRAAAAPVLADTPPEPDARGDDSEGQSDAAETAPAASPGNKVEAGAQAEPETGTIIQSETIVAAALADATAQGMTTMAAAPVAAVLEPAGVDTEGSTAHAPAQEPQPDLPAKPAAEASVPADDSVTMEAVPHAARDNMMADDAATAPVQAGASVPSVLTQHGPETSPHTTTETVGDEPPVEELAGQAPDVAPTVPDMAATDRPPPAPAAISSAAVPSALGPRQAKDAGRPAPRSRKGLRIGAVEIGAGQVGALALGALAIGALAIGALAIGRLAVGRAHVRRLEVDELVIGTVKDKTRRR